MIALLRRYGNVFYSMLERKADKEEINNIFKKRRSYVSPVCDANPNTIEKAVAANLKKRLLEKVLQNQCKHGETPLGNSASIDVPEI